MNANRLRWFSSSVGELKLTYLFVFYRGIAENPDERPTTEELLELFTNLCPPNLDLPETEIQFSMETVNKAKTKEPGFKVC